MADPHSTFVKTAAPGAQSGAKEFGVPASVTLAQAILESGWGEFHLGPANNYFGIKAFAHGGRVDVGPIASGFVIKQTREHVGSRDVVVSARFRSYRSLADSIASGSRSSGTAAISSGNGKRWASASSAAPSP